MVVERRVGGDGATQTNVSAKFMRLSTPVNPDLAERLVGSKLDFPGPQETPSAAGTCRVSPGGSLAEAAQRGAGTIELIDVGDVTLHAGPAVMPLAPRAFPDVGNLVSGMFYTSLDTARDLPADAMYTLESSGSGFVDRFTVNAEAPPALEDVRVGDAALADGVWLDEGTPAALRWSAARPEKTRGARDVVLVDVSAASGTSIRCAFRDDGHAVLPGWVLREATLGALPATATLTVHRVRERSFVAPGINAGEVRFDLSVIGRIFVSAPILGDAREHPATIAPHAALVALTGADGGSAPETPAEAAHARASIELEQACDFSGAAREALLAGDSRRAAHLAALGGDAALVAQAIEAIATRISTSESLRAARDLAARGFGRHAGALFARLDAHGEAGEAFAATGEAVAAARELTLAGRPADARARAGVGAAHAPERRNRAAGAGPAARSPRPDRGCGEGVSGARRGGPGARRGATPPAAMPRRAGPRRGSAHAARRDDGPGHRRRPPVLARRRAQRGGGRACRARGTAHPRPLRDRPRGRGHAARARRRGDGSASRAIGSP